MGVPWPGSGGAAVTGDATARVRRAKTMLDYSLDVDTWSAPLPPMLPPGVFGAEALGAGIEFDSWTVDAGWHPATEQTLEFERSPMVAMRSDRPTTFGDLLTDEGTGRWADLPHLAVPRRTERAPEFDLVASIPSRSVLRPEIDLIDLAT